MPPLKDDEWHCMTVLPYLFDHFYDSTEDANNVQYFTERQLNGMHILSFGLPNTYHLSLHLRHLFKFRSSEFTRRVL